MTATSQNFTMHSGDHHTLEFTVNDTGGSPVDISGATFDWRLAEFSDADGFATWTGSALVTKTSEVSIIDAVNGRVDIPLLPADTADLKGVYYHELQMTLGGLVTTVAKGVATIYGDLVV